MIRLISLALIGLTCLIVCSCGGTSTTTPTQSNKQATSNASAAPSTGNASVSPTAYKVEWLDKNIPAVMDAGKEQSVTATLKNASDATWPSKAINISYHWFTASDDKMVDKYDGARTALPHDIAAGEQFTVNNIKVDVPKQAGSYLLQLTLVHENVTWFENKGASTLTVPVTVR